MMEFVIARVSACICAAIMIGMMFIPVTDSLMRDTDENVQTNCDMIGIALDRFMSSESDEAILFLSTYLPGSDSSLSFNDNILTILYSDESYTYILRYNTVPDSDRYYYGDTIKLSKTGEEMDIDRMVP